MLKFIRNNLRAVVLAVLVHVALIAMLVISLDWTPKPQPASAQDAVVQATVVDDSVRKAAQQKKEKELEAERKRLAELEAEKQKREEEQKHEAEAEAQRVADELKQQALAEQEKIRQEQQAAEQKRLETAKREAAVKEKQAEEAKRQTEQVKREEEKRLAAAEAQRKLDAEKKRKSEKEARQRKEAEQQLKDQLASEEQATSERQAQTLISQYIPLIQNRVKSRWLPPPNARPGMSCTVTVRLIPGGEVIDARVTTSSGDPIFDRSVESAVYKASPLPLPPDPALFEYFRELNFIFKP